VSDTPNLDWLRKKVGQLHELLEDPQPGLMSWQMFYATYVKELTEFWSDKEADGGSK
jgi:hypothetical protein